MRHIRNVSFELKPGKSAEFNKLFTNDVLPILKKQPGFQHEIAMVNGSSAVGVSVWADASSAEKYKVSTYPEIVKKLSSVLEGTPSVTDFEMSATTLTA